MEMMSLPIVAMVTDRRRYGIDEEQALDGLVRGIQAAARAGVTMVQVRERGLTDARLFDLVLRILAAVADTPATVIVNERTDIALAAGAAGVHLRSTSPPASRVRALVSDNFIVGRSVHGREEALRTGAEGGCNYLVFGTVFPSTSKPASDPASGLDALKRVCESVAVPVVAIGGISEARASEVAAAGAAGVAAIELFARQHTDESLRAIVARIRASF